MLDILSETSPCFGSSIVVNNFRYSTLGIIAWNLLPFSRGNVKITVISLASVYCYSFHVNLSHQSTDPFKLPQVNVNYFSVDVDLDIQVGGARLARKILTTAPLR